MKTQWECFLQNIGEWEGSFTTFGPDGAWREDIPSQLKLAQLQPQLASLTLTRESPRFPQPLTMEFGPNFSRGLVFFEPGAFSQGSIQLSPIAAFGGEFGITTPDRRLRMVLMYDNHNQLDYVTLIREKQAGSGATERPPLQADDLIGEWQGEAVTLTPDWQAREFSSRLVIDRVGDILNQQLYFGDRAITTTARIDGSVLRFEHSKLPVQILLLPDGASANCPTSVSIGQPFVLETGWLESPTKRHRCMRTYNEKGEWTGVTLVVETKVA
jgi:hypothetical protein